MSKQLRDRAGMLVDQAETLYQTASVHDRAGDLARVVADLALVVAELTRESDDRHDTTSRGINLALGAGR